MAERFGAGVLGGIFQRDRLDGSGGHEEAAVGIHAMYLAQSQTEVMGQR